MKLKVEGLNSLDDLLARPEAAVLLDEAVPARGEEEKNKVFPSWEPPIPFRDTQVEPFPLEVLPFPLKGIVAEISEIIQVPVDLPAMVAFSACAVPLARKLEIKISDSHKEPLNLYTLTILESGNRKSAVFRELTKPLYAFEKTLRERKLPEIKASEQEYRILESRLKTLEAQAAKEKNPIERERITQEAIEIARTMKEPPKLPRIMTDDVTQEKLSTLMIANNQRMAVLSPEGDFFEALGRYDKNGKPNIGLLIKAHGGDPWSGDRMTREGTLDNPALTLGLLGQREILRGLVEKPAFRGRGLLARFLYSIPKSTVGNRPYKEQPISETVRRVYRSAIERLFDLPWNGTIEEREPHVLTLSKEASVEWIRFYDEIEKDLAPGGRLDWLADWGSKLPGHVARIAGIFHSVTVETSSPWEVPVGVETVLASIALGHYFKSHTVAAFKEMGADRNEGEAQAVLAWIERRGITKFKAGDILGSLSRFHSMAELEPILTILHDRFFIRGIAQERKGQTGRPPSQVFEVNPYILNPASKTSNTSKRDLF